MPSAETEAGRSLRGRANPGSTRQARKVFWLLALVNVFVGSMVGLERTIVPILAGEDFALGAGATIGGFVIAFALAKAFMNLLAGAAADRWGRRRVLIIGWIVSLPVAPLLAWTPTWGAVVFANVLLGVGQALTWSMTLNMMVDLAHRSKRGFAAGVNEFAGYLGVAATASLTGFIASHLGLRPWPFVVGSLLALLGLGLSFGTRETAPVGRSAPPRWTLGVGVPSLLGLFINLKDGLVWLSLPLLLSDRGLTIAQIGVVAGIYPLLWAAGQPLFGPLSDRVGRRPLVALGMLLQGTGLLVLAGATTYGAAIVSALILGLGTGMAYPVLIAVVADRAPVEERATALGIYRFFRDSGYAAGALIAGFGLLHLGEVTAWTGIAFVPLALLAWHSLRQGYQQ